MSKISQVRPAIWARDDPFCHYCRSPLTVECFTVDHIVPRALGGSDGMFNLVLCCTPCNNEKGATVSACRCRRCKRAVERFRADRLTLAQFPFADLDERLSRLSRLAAMT